MGSPWVIPVSAVVGEPLTLAEVLDALAGTSLGIHIDLKHPADRPCGRSAVRSRGLEERVIVSATWVPPLRRLAQELPSAGRAIGYPRDRVGVAKIAWPAPGVRAGVAALRAVMPARARALVAVSRANVLSLHHALVSPAVVRAAHAGGAALFAWTVNEPDRVAGLAEAGVDGIVSDDPEMVVRVLATLKSS